MIVRDVQFEKSAPEVAQAPKGDLPEICFVGRSNVGKSSALNTLTNRRQMARVSKTPGRTQLLNFFRVEISDRPGEGQRIARLRLCDLPGYGFAKAPKSEVLNWKKMVSAYLKEREALAAVVMLVDAEVGPQPKDVEMLDFLAGTKKNLIVVGTKADRLSRTRRGTAIDRIVRELAVPKEAVLLFSSHENIGHDALWNALCAAADVLGRKSDHILEAAPTEPGES